MDEPLSREDIVAYSDLAFEAESELHDFLWELQELPTWWAMARGWRHHKSNHSAVENLLNVENNRDMWGVRIPKNGIATEGYYRKCESVARLGPFRSRCAGLRRIRRKWRTLEKQGKPILAFKGLVIPCAISPVDLFGNGGGLCSSAHESAIMEASTAIESFRDARDELRLQGFRSDYQSLFRHFREYSPEYFKRDVQQIDSLFQRLRVLLEYERSALFAGEPQRTFLVKGRSFFGFRRATGGSPPLPNSTAVILQGRNHPAIVNGKPKALREAQYDLIEALTKARPCGLTKDSIERIKTDARGILQRMKNDSDWNSVIHMAGTVGGRYRID